MAIFALSSSSSPSLPNPNLFAPLPSPSPPNDTVSSASTTHSISPPIPIPKYPPPKKPQKNPKHPALKTTHRNSRYFKPVKPGEVISHDPNRSVIIGESGVSYQLPGAPFEFQYSYSETPKAKPLAIREPAFLPFAPPTMARPWTGKAPLKKAKEKGKKVPLLDSFSPAPPGKKEVKYLEMPAPLWFGKFPKDGRSREEVLGQPLKKWEVKMLVQPMLSDNRQINLGE